MSLYINNDSDYASCIIELQHEINFCVAIKPINIGAWRFAKSSVKTLCFYDDIERNEAIFNAGVYVIRQGSIVYL